MDEQGDLRRHVFVLLLTVRREQPPYIQLNHGEWKRYPYPLLINNESLTETHGQLFKEPPGQGGSVRFTAWMQPSLRIESDAPAWFVSLTDR